MLHKICQDAHSHEELELRILVVEDNPFQQVIITLLLKQLGHRVSVASDGFETLSAIQQERYDVIFMDCELGLMDGFQATQFIREMERATGQRTTIIGISASAVSEQCFQAGMDNFLSKPMNKMILRAELGNLIRQKKNSNRQSSSR
ncbi:MAG: response regulator [Cyanobacteria bacterium]|nr:response regulator [Cyanobacteriota bacterium]